MEKDEVYWEQRTRVNWLKSGDKNTKFFHSYASQRRSSNSIKSLEGEDGRRMEYNVEMGEIATNFFKNLFTSPRAPVEREHILSGVERCIDKYDNLLLSIVYIEEEVNGALKDMGPTKASGSDGFSTIFFQ